MANKNQKNLNLGCDMRNESFMRNNQWERAFGSGREQRQKAGGQQGQLAVTLKE
jgi:hypothetical protein